MCDATVAKPNEMADGSVGTRDVIGAHPRCDLLLLVINDDHRPALMIELGELFGEVAGKHPKQTSCQASGEQSVDDLAAIAVEILVVKGIEDKFVRSLLKDFGDALYQLCQNGPCKNRNQHADQAIATVGQTSRGDTWHVALLVDDLQDPLARLALDVRTLIKHTRHRCPRHTRQPSNVLDGQFLCRSGLVHHLLAFLRALSGSLSGALSAASIRRLRSPVKGRRRG